MIIMIIIRFTSNTNKSVTILHNDPAAVNHNGYHIGSYYIGVYGWCTPDVYVVNAAKDFPCSYFHNIAYNLTITLDYVDCNYNNNYNKFLVIIIFISNY